MMMILIDLGVFLLSLRWPRSGDVWSRIYPLLGAAVSKILYMRHTNTAVHKWKYMPGKFECIQKVSSDDIKVFIRIPMQQGHHVEPCP
jgi:hypothetical protein